MKRRPRNKPTISRLALGLLQLLFICAGQVSAQASATPSIIVANATVPMIEAVRAAKLPDLKVVRAFPNLSFDHPLELVAASDGSSRLLVAEQTGKIFAFTNSDNSSDKIQVIDISSKISQGSERGLLGLALHPNFANQPFIFLYYTHGTDGSLVIARFSIDPKSMLADPNSERVILRVDHPRSNHNGGKLLFGPDRFLYVGLGDGGGAGDPEKNGQNLKSLLGKILRIDVDRQENGNYYAIPADNPFVRNSIGARQEIFAYGFRNPWRFSFDSVSRELWLADVGQNAREEVNLVEAGKNYGWSRMEGSICYPQGDLSCDRNGLTPPLSDYDRSVGQSITGGYVYRGRQIPALSGAYIYGDFSSGAIFGLVRDNASVNVSLLVKSGLNISSFGVDTQDEILILSYTDGHIYRLAAH